MQRSTYIANYIAVHSCNLLSISSQFLSNYLATNIESGLKFTYDIERRYKNYKLVKNSPAIDSPSGEYMKSRIFFNGDVVDCTDPRLIEIEASDLSKKEVLYRVSRYDSHGNQIFVEETLKEIGARYVILHNGESKMKWDMFIGLFIVFSVCAIPVEIAFSIDPPTGLYEFEAMIDILFGLDILISCRTTYFDEVNDYIETIPWEILRHYFKTWFFIDFSSTVPFDLVMQLAMGGEGGGDLASIRIIKFVRLVRIMKMFRLTKLVSIFNKLENKLGISPAFFELIKYLMIVILMVHFIACLWWYASVSFTSMPWFDPDDEANSMHLIDSDLGDQYIASLYFTFTTLATVGYGDLVPKRMEEQLLDSFIMLIGATIFGYIIASIASLIGGLNRSAAISQARLTEMSAYLNERSAPRDLTREIVRYFSHMFDQKTAYDEAGILDRLPKSLKHKIQLMQYGDIIDRIALFNYIENKSVVLYIFENLVLTYFEPNKIIIREGNYANSIMFLIYGKAVITKAINENVLNAKRFRHINNRQREFFNGDKISEKGPGDRKNSRDSRTSSRMRRSMSFFSRSSKEKSTVHAAEEFGMVASGLDMEMSEAARGGGQVGDLVGKGVKFRKMKDFYTNDPKEDVHVGELAAGQFVGHIALMNKAGKHCASVVSSQSCTFYSLSRSATYRILEDQPCVGLVLEMALGEAISDLKMETGSKMWWEQKKIFLKSMHQKHIKFKANNNPKSTKHRSSFIPASVQNRLKIPKIVFPFGPKKSKIDEEEQIIAERRWDKVRTLIKRAWVTAQVSKNLGTTDSDGTRKSETAALIDGMDCVHRNEGAGPTFNNTALQNFPVASSSSGEKADIARMTVEHAPTSAPVKGLKRHQSVFTEVLSFDLGEKLENMFKEILETPSDDLERNERMSESVVLKRSSLKRSATISSFHNEDHISSDIREGLLDILHPKVKPSTYKMRRRQTFPAPVDFPTWKDDRKHLHVI